MIFRGLIYMNQLWMLWHYRLNIIKEQTEIWFNRTSPLFDDLYHEIRTFQYSRNYNSCFPQTFLGFSAFFNILKPSFWILAKKTSHQWFHLKKLTVFSVCALVSSPNKNFKTKIETEKTPSSPIIDEKINEDLFNMLIN